MALKDCIFLQCTIHASLNFASQKHTCDGSFAQALCFRALEVASVRHIIEQEKENKAEIGILLFYRNSKECQCQQGSLKCWGNKLCKKWG